MASHNICSTFVNLTKRQQAVIPKKLLGRTGLEVTQLGYGSMGIRGPNTWGIRVVSDESADEFLNLVLDSGINFIDTAPDYGVSEERIGRFIGARRSEYFLATKCGCDYQQHGDHIEISHRWEKAVVQRNLEQSLARLRTDCIDVLQFHGGDALTLSSSGLIDYLCDLKSQGVIRFMGVSSKLPDLNALIDLEVFDTFQMPYSCLAPAHEAAMTRAANTGAGIIIRGGVAQGGPDAEIQRPALNDIWNAACLDELLPADMTRAEAILRYTISHPACHTTIVGTCNKDHLQENLQAMHAGPLPVELYRAIASRVAHCRA